MSRILGKMPKSASSESACVARFKHQDMDKFGSLDSMATKASLLRSSSRVGCGSATRMNTSEKSMLAQASVFMLEGFSFLLRCSRSRRRMKKKRDALSPLELHDPAAVGWHTEAKTEAKPMFGFWGPVSLWQERGHSVVKWPGRYDPNSLEL